MKKPPAKKNPSPGRRDSHRIMDFNFHSLIASIDRITGPGRWPGKASRSRSLMVGLVGSLWVVPKAMTMLRVAGV
jgi:hypothetical protein